MMDTDNLVRHVRSVFAGMWRHRWTGVLVAWAVAALGIASVALMKDRYEASARVYVDTQTVLKPLMAGLAFQPDIDQQVRMLARTLISRPNVEELLQRSDIQLAAEDKVQRERAITQLMDRIKIVPNGTGNLYTVMYRDTEPSRALHVVAGLVDLFMESSVNAKKHDSQEASRFVDEQIREYEAQLTQSENRLKEFKLRNFGVSGVSDKDYFARMSALADEVTRLRVELSAAERSRDALRRELTAEEPQLPPGAMALGGPVPHNETDARLETQRRQLDDLLRRYTDEHPDVVSTRRTIALLEAQKRQEAAARATEGPARGAATNPVFQRIRMALADAEANVAALRTRLAAQQERLDQVRAMATRIPQAEAELAQLNRDYDIIRKNYEQLVARREAASLGVKIDESANMADFRIVEPARVAPTAVFPSRKIVAFVVLFLALGAGLAAAFAMHWIKPVCDSDRVLRQISGRPVLGTVSFLMDDVRRGAERRGVTQFATAVVGLVFVNLGWLGFLIVAGRA